MEILRSVSDVDALAALFFESFTAAEGPDEGRVIGQLVRDLSATTPPADLRMFVSGSSAAVQPGAPEGGLAGAILLTRLRFGDDPRKVFLLSPVAVAPTCQRRGVASALIRAAFDALRAEGVAAVFTYGDPAFYGRLGFAAITPQDAPPPCPLSQPQGWQVRALTDALLLPFPGPSRCAAALNVPELW